MFPGCTLSDMLIRQADLLREAGYEPQPRYIDGQWIISRRPRLDRLVMRWILSLLAVLGCGIALR